MSRRLQPQQTTVSIRISHSLRDYLERARKALSNGRGNRPPISDVAKLLIEESRRVPLDDRLRVASLLLDPTATLVAIRSKLECQAMLSPAEWVVLARYIEVASEGTAEDRALPKRESFLELLEAFHALLKVRIRRVSSLDSYYLKKLIPSGFEKDGDDPRAISVDALVDNLIAHLNGSGSHVVPIYVGRALHVALRDEEYRSALALHESLIQFLPTLYRVAARGHWLVEHRPVRPAEKPFWRGEDPYNPPAFPPVTACAGEFRVTPVVTQDGDLTMTVKMESRMAVYQLGTYPQVREFTSLLERLPETGYWRGAEFGGYTDSGEREAGVTQLYIRHNGTAFGFSPSQWDALKGAFRQALVARACSSSE